MQNDRLSLAGLQPPRPPKFGRRLASQMENTDDGSDLELPEFDDDSLLDPIGKPWDPLVLEDDEEPEPEYGDFWPEPDEFDD